MGGLDSEQQGVVEEKLVRLTIGYFKTRFQVEHKAKEHGQVEKQSPDKTRCGAGIRQTCNGMSWDRWRICQERMSAWRTTKGGGAWNAKGKSSAPPSPRAMSRQENWGFQLRTSLALIPLHPLPFPPPSHLAVAPSAPLAKKVRKWLNPPVLMALTRTFDEKQRMDIIL